MAKARAAAMTEGEAAAAALLAPGRETILTMTGGQRPDSRAAWIFLWEGITVPIKFDPQPPSV